jgi:hypothetical protein
MDSRRRSSQKAWIASLFRQDSQAEEKTQESGKLRALG